MKYNLNILRRAYGSDTPYIKRYEYTSDNNSETVATALTAINERMRGEDKPVKWECNCLQKKCGACAMVINGKPMLACDAKLSDLGENIKIEPLRKFPVIEDLVVDRSVMFQNLKEIKLWFEDVPAPKNTENALYEASRCLQCGCCLEVCPNFVAGGEFAGMAAAVPMARLMASLPQKQRKEAARLYTRRVYNGCGKSLACHNICPAGIDIEKLMVNSNAAAVWKRFSTAFRDEGKRGRK